MSNHLIAATQFRSPDQLEAVFAATDDLKLHGPHPDALKGRLMATFFNEPSTRTRTSFESAMTRLGGSVLTTPNGRQDSSGAKGESLADTLRTLGLYAEVVVVRHEKDDAVRNAFKFCEVPVINAGEGRHEHPTQALLDLYTVSRKFGGIDGLSFLITGDVAYSRTVKSLLRLLSLFDVDVALSVPYPKPTLNPAFDIPFKGKVSLISDAEIKNYLPTADVVYMTRHQTEREGERAVSQFVMTPEWASKMRPDAAILHPLPRGAEIDPRVDADPRAGYFDQARNGLFVRMAVLSMALGKLPVAWDRVPNPAV